MPLNIQDNDQFFQWILDQIEDDPQEIANFISSVVPTEAMEHFNNAWIEYVERMRDEDA